MECFELKFFISAHVFRLAFFFLSPLNAFLPRLLTICTMYTMGLERAECVQEIASVRPHLWPRAMTLLNEMLS